MAGPSGMCRGNRSRHVSLNRSLSLPQGSSSAVVRAVRKEEEEMDKSVSEHDDEDGAVAAVANAAVAVAVAPSSSSSRADSGYSQGSSQESLALGATASNIGGEDEQKPTVTSSEDEDVEGKGKKGSKRARTEEEEEECFKREEEFKMSRNQNGYASSSANTTDSAAMVPGEGKVRLTRTIATSRPELLCNFCLSREKNAGIIHGGIIHQICCYPCAKRLYKRKQPCPMCRRRIEKISKIIVG